MPTPSDYQDPGQPYRNLQPGASGAPGYFTVANPTGGPPVPGRTTESSTRNGNPQATQTAAAPPPTPGTLITDGGVPGLITNRAQGTPTPFARQLVAAGVNPPNAATTEPTPPTPNKAAPPPEPAAKPLPNLGAWTPDQAKPWMHVKPIAPQQVPDRPPDTHVGTRPAYHPRPGEPGYTTGPQQPGQPYTFGMFLGKALQHGFTGQAAYDMAAIGLAESQGYANRVHVNDGGKGFNSYGALQINGSNDAALIKAGFPGGARAALDIDTAFAEAYVLSKGGTDFSPWSTFNDKSYLRYLDGNARPEASSTLVVGPRQAYRPSVEREPGQWGSTPERDWTPGNMPTAHDIPGILGALLPIAIAGVLGGGGLGMIAAYSGYQNARNKAQQEEAKEQKTKWKDALEETTSRLKLQLLGAKGIMAEYGDLNDPRAKQELLELALKTDDKQLLSAIENGDMNTVGHLLNTRDKIFQDLSKTKDAQDRADAKEAKEDADARTQAEPFGQSAPTAGEHRTTEPTQQPFFPEGGAPAATPAAAPAPSGGDGGGGPAAGTPQQPFPERGRPAPAAAGGGAPAPAEEPPPDGAPQPAPDGAPQPPTGAPPAIPAAAPAAPAPYGPEIESLAAGFVMGNTDLTGIPKNQQAQVQGRAAQLQNQLNAIPKNLQGQDLVRAVGAINPQMASTLNNLLNYRQGVPQAGETSGGQAGRMLPFWTRMIDLAHQADNTWNPDNYDLYRKSREDFRPGGAMGAPIQRSNKLLASTAAVLDSINEIERKSGGKINETELEAAINALITKGVTGTGEYSGLMGALRNFALESTAVSEAGRPTVTMADAIISAIPPSRTPADIRAFVKKDLWGAVSAIETAHDTWKQLPGNATTEPLGYRDDVFRGLSAVAMTLDPATGNIEGKDLPPVLRSVIPRAAPAPRPGEGGGPTTGGGGQPTWATGTATGPNGEKVYTDGKGWFHADHTPVQ